MSIIFFDSKFCNLQYRCFAVIDSKRITMLILDSPKGQPSLTVSKSVAVEAPVVFNCDSNKVDSQPDITNFIFNHKGQKEVEEEQSTWETTFTSISKSGGWSCQTKNSIGVGESSASVDVTVEGTCNAKCKQTITRTGV